MMDFIPLVVPVIGNEIMISMNMETIASEKNNYRGLRLMLHISPL